MDEKASPVWESGNWGHRFRKNEAGVVYSPDWLGADAQLYQPANWQPADNIKVAQFRQIYIWPLSLRLRGTDIADISQAVAEAAKAIGAAEYQGRPLWKEIEDLLDHVDAPGPADRVHQYGEFVYFHDFVQSILFKPRGDKEIHPAIRIFRNLQIKHMAASLNTTLGVWTFRATLSRVNLYLFGSGACCLVAEANFDTMLSAGSTQRAMTLADAEAFIDRGRRSYTPWFEATATGPLPRGVPIEFKWLDADGKDISPEPEWAPASFSDDFSHIRERRVAPVAAYWRRIIHPLIVDGYEPDGAPADGPVWRHIVDERIPLLSFVSLSGAAQGVRQGSPNRLGQYNIDAQIDLSLVSRGDWVRICYADGPGQDVLPYGPTFLHNFEREACYDRFFPSDAADSATRFLFAGYHFAAVGAGGFFDTVLVHHFRRQYFQMGLLVTMELASMLVLSGRISEAVRQRRRNRDRAQADEQFTRTMIKIESDFLELTHLYLFRGLSNQTQPIEMYSKWRKTLALDELYEDTKSEIEAAVQFLRSVRQDEQAAAQMRQAEAANRLSTVAVVGVVLGLAFSLAQIGAITMHAPKWIPVSRLVFKWIFTTSLLGLTFNLFLGKTGACREYNNKHIWSKSPYSKLINWVLVVCAVSSALLCAMTYYIRL